MHVEASDDDDDDDDDDDEDGDRYDEEEHDSDREFLKNGPAAMPEGAADMPEQRVVFGLPNELLVFNVGRSAAWARAEALRLLHGYTSEALDGLSSSAIAERAAGILGIAERHGHTNAMRAHEAEQMARAAELLEKGSSKAFLDFIHEGFTREQYKESVPPRDRTAQALQSIVASR